LALTIGARLASYEILSALGAGGMGEVYRARDAKLGRGVALILPDAFATDPDRLARFQREAKVLASLNHPNIGGIYGLEEANPSPGSRQAAVMAIVMELVPGEDLAQRIARAAIPLNEALPIAQQIAGALEAAHEQGIVHRDLKPANVKVREDHDRSPRPGLSTPSSSSHSVGRPPARRPHSGSDTRRGDGVVALGGASDSYRPPLY